uniref:Uncharacterized protein n=1 Tax=Rhizophora mucronata TaxID=61149 RepID=A0A2P2K9P9_RHIMU
MICVSACLSDFRRVFVSFCFPFRIPNNVVFWG